MNSSGNIENFISIIEDIVDVHLKIIHMKYNSHANFDLGKYFRREKHPCETDTENLPVDIISYNTLAIRFLEHMGFSWPMERPETDRHLMTEYRIVDFLRKIPRNLSHNGYFGQFIDIYQQGRARHGGRIRVEIEKLLNVQSLDGNIFKYIINRINSKCIKILNIPQVRSGLIHAILYTRPNSMQLTRVCNLINFSLKCCNKSYKDKRFDLYYYDASSTNYSHTKIKISTVWHIMHNMGIRLVIVHKFLSELSKVYLEKNTEFNCTMTGNATHRSTNTLKVNSSTRKKYIPPHLRSRK